MSTTTSLRPTNSLRVVIIGAGAIGAVHRRAALLNGAEVVGVMASTAERSQAAAEQWGTRAVSLNGLADLAPDVVHVCSPNANHTEHVGAALAAGAHVVCEKPLAINAQSAQKLVDLAHDRERVATVPFVYRFHPLVREIRHRVQEGDFGRWQLLHGSYLQDWLISPDSTSWRVDPAAGGPSRTFADIGSHWVDLLEYLSGERIASVVAAMDTTVPERPVGPAATFGGSVQGKKAAVTTEDVAGVMFRTATGVLGSLVVSQVSAGRKNRLWIELDGEHQSAVFDQENPETVWLGTAGEARVVSRDPSRGAPDQRRLSNLPPGHPQGYAQCFENFIADTYAAVLGQVRAGLPTFEDGLRSAHVIEAVLQSVQTQTWVDVPHATVRRQSAVPGSAVC